MKIGYFEHWSRPHWSFMDFLKEEGYEIEKIDYSVKDYLEQYDVAIVEQNGFNDYIENDEPYIQDWVKRGGIFLFMHQDYQRWAPCFLPEELQNTKLIHRYIPTLSCGNCRSLSKDGEDYYSYMIPWMEEAGRTLFTTPEKITPDEMLKWRIKVNSFTVLRGKPSTDISITVRTAAQSCFLVTGNNWEVLGSYMDPATMDGALVLQAKYGKGLYFLNQILVPEVLNEEAESCLNFWRKYIKNLFTHLENFKNGITLPVPPKGTISPDKRNYKVCIHMHSLDWYGADAQPGMINAIMRMMNYDICALALKDAAPYKGSLDPKKYSDDKVLFLDGQEYHPFNWKDSHEDLSHNGYHILAVGTDYEAYTPRYTKSLYGDQEVDEYLKDALKYVKDHNGASVATHPPCGYWHDYPYDAVDMEPLMTLAGTPIEEYWLKGKKITVMDSVDLFGYRRIFDNPATNFTYLNGETPCRDSVVKAIKAGHVIASCGFDEADFTLDGKIPGDTVDKSAKTLYVKAESKLRDLTEVVVFADDKVILRDPVSGGKVEKTYELPEHDAKHFIRVEVHAEHEEVIAVGTPFYF